MIKHLLAVCNSEENANRLKNKCYAWLSEFRNKYEFECLDKQVIIMFSKQLNPNLLNEDKNKLFSLILSVHATNTIGFCRTGDLNFLFLE